ncbi:MAG TPA: hypothetical protein VML19_31305 [Verrucomicrobiae bacterium]|nr:hypothetical protein [Verrucomicrobiae bacterium]
MRYRWNAAIVAAGLTVLAAPAWSQYPPNTYPPGQYPPNTYPPNTYPPGQYPPGGYPPNTYPPNTVPVRLPGGVPVGVPVPEPKIPKKESKGGGGSEQITIASVDGTLRKLGEKDLVLGVKRALLHFRLLAKTKFVDAKGEYVRDSLLHPGDQLQAQANPDDPETAVRVVFIRAGTAAERTAADRPFDPDSARTPRAGDLSKPRTVTARASEASAEAPEGDSAAPEKSDGKSEGASDGSPATPDAGSIVPGSRPQTDEAILADARAESAKFSSSLPNYLAQQVTTRYFATGIPSHWQEIDVVTAELSYVNGKEDYRDFRIDNVPIDRPVESTGSWSTGEFATTLEDVLSSATNALFHRRGEDTVSGRKAWVFDYTVAQSNSHWTMVAPDGRKYNPAYSGAIWIDKETRRVLRIEQGATAFPRDLWLSRADSTIEYAYVKIDQKTYLMPAKGDTSGCMSGSGACSRNSIEFRNYRKFTADSKIDFGK